MINNKKDYEEEAISVDENSVIHIEDEENVALRKKSNRSRRRRSLDTTFSLEMYYVMVEEMEKRMFDEFDVLLAKFSTEKVMIK